MISDMAMMLHKQIDILRFSLGFYLRSPRHKTLSQHFLFWHLAGTLIGVSQSQLWVSH